MSDFLEDGALDWADHMADVVTGVSTVPSYPSQCVTCSRFVKVSDRTTRRIPEYGDYGLLLNTEFECGRCVAARIAPGEASS